MVPPPPETPETQLVPPRPSRADGSDLLAQTARALGDSDSLEALSRPFLDLIHRITGLESVYLSEVDEQRDDYRVLFSDNRGDLDITEGQHIAWQDTLCRRAMDRQIPTTDDASRTFADAAVAKQLGIGGFVSVPVVSSHNILLGTLCSASSRSTPVAGSSLDVMRLLADLLANQWERDLHLAEQRRRADDAEANLRSRATLLAEAEHKLKTPLTVIRGWSELMVGDWESLADDRRRDGAQIIHEAAVDATRQVERLLDEARNEVLATELHVAQVDLVGLLGRLVRQLSGVAAGTHQVSLRTDGVLRVLADPEALWQALWHLAENALKYSPDGGEIRFAAERVEPGRVEAGRDEAGRDEAGEHPRGIVITVRDHGLGLPYGIDIFAPFVRGDQHADHRNDHRGEAPGPAPISGSGIGLHVVKTLVTAMGGSVHAGPAPGAGSVFTVWLPAADQRAS